MDKIPEDRDARLAFLEGWANEQQGQLYAEALVQVLAEARQRMGPVDSVRESAVIPVVVTKPSDLPVERAAVFADLMVRLRGYSWADPIVSVCDEPRHIAPKAIDLARRHRRDAPWLLYMEDDVILGPDFGLLPGLLEEVDELFPDTGIASFFSGSFGEPGWSIRSLTEFAWLQCAAIRNTDYLGGFRAFIDSGVIGCAGKRSTTPGRYEFPPSRRTRPSPPSDHAVGTFLAAEYDAYALWCPSLVQHADLPPVFSGQAKDAPKRISKSYRAAYGERLTNSPCEGDTGARPSHV